MKAVALIPARGGSKRLPRKNIVEFHGQPIIAYSITAALESDCFESVVVSTEDEEIAEVATKWGAAVDLRDPSLATDEARVKDVCMAFLDKECAAGREYEILSVLYATSPLRTADDVQAVVKLIEPGRCQYGLATTRFSLPPHQALKRAEDGTLEPMWPDVLNRRSSDMPALEVDNGSTYAVYVPAFRETVNFYGPRGEMRGYLMPAERSVDIDTPKDLELAEYYFTVLQNRG